MTRCGPGCPRAGCGRRRPEGDRPGPPGGVVSGTGERSGASSWSGGAMRVVVGYVSTPEGDAALDVGVSEARLRGLRLVVILSERGHRLGLELGRLRAQADEVRRRLDGTGLRYDVRLTTRGHDVADDIIGAASREEAV